MNGVSAFYSVIEEREHQTAFAPVSPELGWYLAGLADGEGCFHIRPNRSGETYACGFTVHLRADDRPLLEFLCDATGLGTVYGGRKKRVGNDQPSIQWRVDKRADCVTLCRIFDQHPLRSKKARDFALWRQAVYWWTRGRSEEMELRFRALRELRKYPEDSE